MNWGSARMKALRGKADSKYFHKSLRKEISRLVVGRGPVTYLGNRRATPEGEWGGRSVSQADVSELGKLSPVLELREWSDCEDGTGQRSSPYIILNLALEYVNDVGLTLRAAYKECSPQTRLVVVSYSRLWQPFLRMAEMLSLKERYARENYIPWDVLEDLLDLNGFEVTQRRDAILMPLNVPLIANFANRWLAPLPILRHLCLCRITVARPVGKRDPSVKSVSVVVAARNEAGNITELTSRIPRLADHQEVIFVEGGSEDETWETIGDLKLGDFPNIDALIALRQRGTGKGDAVREGFEAATGDALVILDADISVEPEQLRDFIEVLRSDQAEFVNGSRFVYPMDERAMRFLNIVGNRFFGYLFTFLLGQRLRDTLCGTKALRRADYSRLASERLYFGDFDPFGDFDLLFGSSRLALRIREVPVHYKERRYGTTNISRFSHGWLLLKMSVFAAQRLKFPK